MRFFEHQIFLMPTRKLDPKNPDSPPLFVHPETIEAKASFVSPYPHKPFQYKFIKRHKRAPIGASESGFHEISTGWWGAAQSTAAAQNSARKALRRKDSETLILLSDCMTRRCSPPFHVSWFLISNFFSLEREIERSSGREILVLCRQRRKRRLRRPRQ